MPSPERVLAIAPAAAYLAADYNAKRQLFGGSKNPKQPIVIFSVYYILKRIYDYSGITSEVNATGSVTIDSIGSTGDEIEGFVDDPVLGSISLGTYSQQSGDTTPTLLAASITSVWNSNPYGYGVSSNAGVITVTSRAGLGATINGGNRLSAVITAFSTFDDTFDSTFS